MTDASKEWHSALRTLRRNGRVARADWPTDVFAPEQLGLTIWGAFISMPETVCLYDEAYLDAQLKQVDAGSTLRLFDAVGSTNSAMTSNAQTQDVGGNVPFLHYYQERNLGPNVYERNCTGVT